MNVEDTFGSHAIGGRVTPTYHIILMFKEYMLRAYTHAMDFQVNSSTLLMQFLDRKTTSPCQGRRTYSALYMVNEL